MADLIVGEYVIDFARCHISKDAEVISVEPKVMEVLECLFKHKNQVVSQAVIFETVWPEAIFNPSSVQRCIAILRKIIEVDTKAPQYIITHPKRGYSLILEEDIALKSNKKRLSKGLLFGAIVLILCFIVLLQIAFHSPEKTSFSHLYPVTSSEVSEHALVLSPKGDLAAFVRIASHKQNQIWLKKLATGQEKQLTSLPSNYQKLGWSRDGTALAYINRAEGRDKIIYQTIDAMTLSALPPVELMNVRENSIVSYQLQWSQWGALYFVEENENAQRLLRQYSLKSGQTSTLATYGGKEQLLTLALSPDEKNLALAVDMHQNKYRVSLFSLMTHQTKDIAILEDSILGLTWHPKGKSLLVSNRNKLQLVELTGKVNNIDFDNFQYVRNAQYSPDGQEIFMELFSLDVDIVYSDRQHPTEYQKIVDTKSLDFLPVYSPLADKFAFQSQRNGLKQLFVYQAGQQRLIFDNPHDQELFGMVWSGDGKTIISASKDKLFVIDVEKSSYTVIAHNSGPFFLREWYANEPALLVSRVTDEGLRPAKFNLETLLLTPLVSPQTNFNCSYMTLDEQDNLLISDDKSIFRVLSNEQFVTIWQAPRGEISGFTLGDTGLSVMLNFAEHFELIAVSAASNTVDPLLRGNYGDKYLLTNTSKNADKFLFVEPNDIKALVKLR